MKKLLLLLFRQLLETFGLLFTPTSGHTAHEPHFTLSLGLTLVIGQWFGFHQTIKSVANRNVSKTTQSNTNQTE